jgi:hypothetical protein
LSVPDEGYSRILSVPDGRLFWVYLMKVILSVPDEGYFECTWWRLFQKHIVHTNFDIYVFIKLLNHCLISSIKSRYFRIYNFMTLKICKNK